MCVITINIMLVKVTRKFTFSLNKRLNYPVNDIICLEFGKAFDLAVIPT